MPHSIDRRLQERVKELTALHRTARLLQDTSKSLDQVVPTVVEQLPSAWQFPELAQARIAMGKGAWSTPDFRETAWIQRESFRLRDGEAGEITIVYVQGPPVDGDEPFLVEERELMGSLAELLRAYFQNHRDAAAILAANEQLELQVAERTASLRRLASQACLAEERERRWIAEGLHDHLGQGLAVIKMRLRNLRGDAVFDGRSAALTELVELADQAIRYTRDLTFELSPPILYELGLGSALEWLGEQTARKHGLQIRVVDRYREQLADDLNVMLWKSARELLHNVVKHARARHVFLGLAVSGAEVQLTVTDDGCGFDAAAARQDSAAGFGLYSIDERLVQLGGRMELDTRPGDGTTVRLCVPLTRKTP